MFTSVSLMSLLRSLVVGFLDLDLDFWNWNWIGIVLVDVGYLDIATA
ncbi:hypothetical protein BSPWISOXPB_52 [uncultured Gammaproteobacteria bacterium]|nr:hypothetical protein BSPWISOXPB_52 [uncultured Gammaproteobacteria bacterium]